MPTAVTFNSLPCFSQVFLVQLPAVELFLKPYAAMETRRGSNPTLFPPPPPIWMFTLDPISSPNETIKLSIHNTPQGSYILSFLSVYIYTASYGLAQIIVSFSQSSTWRKHNCAHTHTNTLASLERKDHSN